MTDCTSDDSGCGCLVLVIVLLIAAAFVTHVSDKWDLLDKRVETIEQRLDTKE